MYVYATPGNPLQLLLLLHEKPFCKKEPHDTLPGKGYCTGRKERGKKKCSDFGNSPLSRMEVFSTHLISLYSQRTLAVSVKGGVKRVYEPGYGVFHPSALPSRRFSLPRMDIAMR